MQNYRDAGIAHLMAVSGTHTAFVLSFVRFLTKRKHLHLIARKIISILFLFFFAAIADFSPSVIRAVLQNAYLLMAPVFRHPAKAKNALCFACIIQIGWNPYVLYNSGFMLSYTAAASIVWIKPPLMKRMRFLSKLPDGIRTGIAVNIGMLPLMIYYFNSISPIGILATLFASKLASVICMTGFSIWIGSYLPAASLLVKIPSYLSSTALYLLRKISIVGSGLPPPLGAFRVPGFRPFSIFLYYALLLFLLYRKKYRPNLRQYIAAVACAGIILTFTWIRADKTEILFFDVGQGFSALIRTRQICGLIDGGDGKTDVSGLLLKQGIGTLDFVILTHGHADHAAGIYDVIKEHTVKCILLPDNPYDEGAAAICAAAALENIEIIRVKGICEYTFGDLSARLCVNELTMISSESSAVNNSSIVTSFRNQNGSVLFTGDIENESETYLTENQWIGKNEVLAVAHHGSGTGSIEKNISIILPEYAIISVGRKNSYGHPSVRVIETLSEVGASIFRSDLCGAVKITMRKGRIYAWRKLTT